MDCESFSARIRSDFAHAEYLTKDLHEPCLAMKAYKIDPDFGDPRSYLGEIDFHHRRPGSAEVLVSQDAWLMRGGELT